jgi:type II secretory pathway component PulK
MQIAKNTRGVALIIVLLITALLIALVFEFAYGTRVSFRAAMNFRDSQRAYFLARSGVNYFKNNTTFVQQHIPRDGWYPLPLVSTADVKVDFYWEDEAGKINIKNVANGDNAYAKLGDLFEFVGINKNILEKIVSSDSPKIQLVTDLHRYMPDDDYNKIAPFLTANSDSNKLININTAPEVVIRSTMSHAKAESILSARKDNNTLDGSYLTGELASGFTVTMGCSKIYSYATVGSYTKKIEAIVNGRVFDYWTVL